MASLTRGSCMQNLIVRTGTTGMLGLVLPGTSNSFFGEYADVIYDAAASAGFALADCQLSRQRSHRAPADRGPGGRNVDGILVATMMSKADIPGLRHPGLPIVLINCPFAVPGYRTLGPDAVAGARAVVDHLLSVHGHQSVAFITGETSVHEPEAREAGWRDALRSHGRPDGLLVRTDFTACGWIRSCAACAGRVRPPDRHVRQL